LAFFGLSVLNKSKVLVIFRLRRGSCLSIINWIQRFGKYPIYKKEKLGAFIIDETVVPDRKTLLQCLFYLTTMNLNFTNT
jgi:hypothetical protein